MLRFSTQRIPFLQQGLMIHQVNVHKVDRFEDHTFCYCYEIFQREYSKMSPTTQHLTSTFMNIWPVLFLFLPPPHTHTPFTHPIPLSARIILKQILAVTSSNIQCSDFSNFLKKIIFMLVSLNWDLNYIYTFHLIFLMSLLIFN